MAPHSAHEWQSVAQHHPKPDLREVNTVKRIFACPPNSSENEAGLSLIEIMVAMFLLAILAVAFIPVLITGLKTSAMNATQATAAQLAGSVIEHARSRAPKCVDLAAYLAGAPETSSSHGTTLTANATSTMACSSISSYPVTVPVTVTVTDDSGTSYTTASTRILLTQP